MIFLAMPFIIHKKGTELENDLGFFMHHFKRLKNFYKGSKLLGESFNLLH